MHEDYFQIEALSASGAKSLLVSPAQYRHERDNPRADTDDFRFGRLVHCLALEPHKADEMAVLLPDRPDLSGVRDVKGNVPAMPQSTTEGKALLAPWQARCDELRAIADAGERYACTADQWAQVKADAQIVAAAILDVVNPDTGWTLRKLLNDSQAQAFVEQAITWNAQVGDDTCRCKARPDAVVSLPDGRVIVVDPKTTRSALTAADLSRTIATFGYHRQAAHYLDALASQGVVDAEFWFIFASKSAPFDACWIKLAQNALIVGANEMDTAKRIYAACTTAGVWPTAQTAGLLPTELDLPRWYRPEE